MRGLFKIMLFVMPEITAVTCQAQNYVINRVPFSSRLNDEFSPVYYRNGIVFCSNMKDNSLINYTDTQNRLFRIFYAEGNDSSGWKNPVLFSRELTSGFNDGPATFTGNDNIVYFSRNNSTDRSLRNKVDTTNKLGIYRADFVNGSWTNIIPFKYNDPLYSLCTPSISPNGKRIFFSSDMPGGYGGMDLYYCTLLNDEEWDSPVNLGPLINTGGNEVFPYAAQYGKLYFASDGLKGLGKKDLFYTTEINDQWSAPVHMDSVINSPDDDFGLVIDTTLEMGYFSSRRGSNDDIFSFRSAPIEFSICDTIKEDSFCFTLFDELYHTIDTIPVTYRWDFGQGVVREGVEVKHCFPGPGQYTVKLTITDDLTGDTITKLSTYDISLEESEQAYIRSSFVGIKDDPLVFDGSEINLSDFTVTDYLWNFGEGFSQAGPVISQVFSKAGEYTIRLGLLGGKDSLGIVRKKCYTREFRIYNSYREQRSDNVKPPGETLNGNSVNLGIQIFFMDDISEKNRARLSSALSPVSGTVISYDNNGIVPESYYLLEKISEILKQNPELRLEMEVYENPVNESVKNTRLWSDEISFFYKDRDLALRCRDMGKLAPVLRSARSTEKYDGMIVLLFMEK